MINRYYFAALLTFFFWIIQGSDLDKAQIKEQLATMVSNDQEVRAKINMLCIDERLAKEKEAIDIHNASILKNILNEYDWMTISEFGPEADHQAWLLVQHADHDLLFQKKILSRLEKLYVLGETSARNYAYLYDRVAIAEKRPQRYATQGYIRNGQWVSYEIEDVMHLDTHRSKVGLPPFQEYLNQINRMFNIPTYTQKGCEC